MTPLEQKYSCERSEWALCTLMNKYKKKDCYNFMPSFTDELLTTMEELRGSGLRGSPSII